MVTEPPDRDLDDIGTAPGPRLWTVSLTADEWAEVRSVVPDRRGKLAVAKFAARLNEVMLHAGLIR